MVCSAGVSDTGVDSPVGPQDVKNKTVAKPTKNLENFIVLISFNTFYITYGALSQVSKAYICGKIRKKAYINIRLISFVICDYKLLERIRVSNGLRVWVVPLKVLFKVSRYTSYPSTGIDAPASLSEVTPLEW